MKYIWRINIQPAALSKHHVPLHPPFSPSPSLLPRKLTLLLRVRMTRVISEPDRRRAAAAAAGRSRLAGPRRRLSGRRRSLPLPGLAADVVDVGVVAHHAARPRLVVEVVVVITLWTRVSSGQIRSGQM